MSRTGEFLLSQFNKRKERNARYSLRAFSRDLDLYPGRVSQYFNGKRPISKKMVVYIADKLKLDKDTQEYFHYLAETDKKTKRNYKARQLQDDELAFIAEWYHFTILSLISTADFRLDYNWMAARTGISEEIIKTSFERLIRLKIISVHEKSVELHHPNLTTTKDVSSAVLRLSHKDSMQYVINRMDQVPVLLRDVSSITLPININKLSEAKDMIEVFRRRLAKRLGDGTKTEVYTMTIGLFPLTQTEKSND